MSEVVLKPIAWSHGTYCKYGKEMYYWEKRKGDGCVLRHIKTRKAIELSGKQKAFLKPLAIQAGMIMDVGAPEHFQVGAILQVGKTRHYKVVGQNFLTGDKQNYSLNYLLKCDEL